MIFAVGFVGCSQCVTGWRRPAVWFLRFMSRSAGVEVTVHQACWSPHRVSTGLELPAKGGGVCLHRAVSVGAACCCCCWLLFFLPPVRSSHTPPPSCMVISCNPGAHRAAGRWLQCRAHMSVPESHGGGRVMSDTLQL